jgi:hypothetical protein
MACEVLQGYNAFEDRELFTPMANMARIILLAERYSCDGRVWKREAFKHIFAIVAWDCPENWW